MHFLGFLHFSLFCLNVEFVHGCEGFTHTWEGREALGEGVSWAQHVVEKIYLMMRSCSFFHGIWAPLKPYAFLCSMGGISEDV